MSRFFHKGTQYYVAEYGNPDDPPLILLHGFAQSSATWAEVAPRLAEGRFVVTPDFIGHGLSGCPDDPEQYEIRYVLEMIAALAHSYGMSRFDLGGYSMGGRIALMYAHTFSMDVASLVLESSGLGPQTFQQHQAAQKRDADLIARLREETIDEFIDYWETLPVFDSQKNLPEEKRQQIRRARLENNTQALALSIRGTGQHSMLDFSKRITTLPMPVLYIAGILDRKYMRIAEKLQHTPGIYCVLVNAGHNTHLEAPDSFCRQVDNFLFNVRATEASRRGWSGSSFIT